MKRYAWLLVLMLLAAAPVHAQPLDSGNITANSSGGACAAVPPACVVITFQNQLITTITLQVSGTYTGTTAFEATSSTNPLATNAVWFSVSATLLSDGSSATGTTTGQTGQFSIPNSGLMGVRVRATSAWTGTAVVAAVRGYATARWLNPFVTRLYTGDGTCPLPAKSYASDTDLGSYRIGANNEGFCAGSTAAFDYNATRVNFALPMYASNGSAAAPADSWLNSATTGAYRIGADNIGYSAAGVLRWDYNTARILSTIPLQIQQGTLTADTPARSDTATWNNAATTFTLWKAVITDTASAAGSLPLQILGGAAGSTTLFSLGKTGLGTFGAAVAFGTGPSKFTSQSDGVVTISNAAVSDFSRLQFGGTTSSFPSIKRNGSGIYIRNGDDSAFTDLNALNIGLGATAGAYYVTTQVIIRTAPTIASGGCTSPAVTWNNGTAAFLITIGTSCTGVKSFTLTMPAVTNRWVCTAENNTSDAAQQTNYAVARATSTTAVVVTSYDRVTGLQEDVTASDTYLVSCLGG